MNTLHPNKKGDKDMDTNESKLYLVTERCEDNKHEVNFLYTSDDLFGPGRFLDDPSKLEQAGDPDWRYLLHREKGDETLEWRLHEVDMTGDMKHAAHEIAEFLSGAHNGPEGTWETDDLRVSPAARKMLAELMRPVLNADFGSQQFMYAYHASEWVKQNPEFMNDLDKVYSTLGLFRVERIRFSVTQGEAAVYCNGHKVVQYGDEICMQLKDGNISRGLFRDPEPGVLYGPVIGGYGSIKPDDKFRKAAIAQYDTFVYDYLQRVPVREVEVWQLGRAEGAHEARFLGYDQNIKLNGIFRPELYEQVWKGSVNANTRKTSTISSIWLIRKATKPRP